jgi:hypothetical protein
MDQDHRGMQKESPRWTGSFSCARRISFARRMDIMEKLGEMERSSEPLVQEFLKDDQQEFHFSDEKEEKMPVGKNSKQEK